MRPPRMSEVWGPGTPYKVKRVRLMEKDGGDTIFFKIDAASRSRQDKFFRPEEVPEFEGEEAWFMMQRVKGRWVFLRQVEPPPGW